MTDSTGEANNEQCDSLCIGTLTVAFADGQGVSGNAANSGISVGDTVIYTSSFFGDELWPADKLGFTRSAIGACPSPVCFVYVSLPPPHPPSLAVYELPLFLSCLLAHLARVQRYGSRDINVPLYNLGF